MNDEVEQAAEPEQKKESEPKRPAKPELNYHALTSREALRLSGEKVRGYRTKRELFEQLRKKGYPVVGV